VVVSGPSDSVRVRRSPKAFLEVAGHCHSWSTISCLDGGCARYEEAGVADDEGEPPVWLDDSANRSQCGIQVRDAHQCQLARSMGQEKYQTDGDPRTSGPGFGVAMHPETLGLSHSWTKPRVVFVNSMSDLFHDRVSDEFVSRVFEVMAATPRHTYQVLTKRSQRLAGMAESLNWTPNIWIGVSVELQKYAFRVDHLRVVDAAVRFVSADAHRTART
jgi:hypothetical protein